jgi:hypothetical protein
MVTLGTCHLDSQYHNEGSLCHGDRKGTHMSKGPYRDKVPMCLSHRDFFQCFVCLDAVVCSEIFIRGPAAKSYT